MKKYLYRVLVCGCIAFSNTTNSQIPTTDIANLVQNLLGYLEQIEEGIRQLEELENMGHQIEGMYEQLDAVSGVRDLANLLNSNDFIELRRLIPENTMNLIDDISSGDLPTSTRDYREILENIYDTYPSIQSGEEYTQRNRSRIRRDREELDNRKTSITVASTSYAYSALKQADENLKNVESLMEELNRAEDMKGSMDLNTRVLAETAMLTNMLLKMQAMSALNPAESTLVDLQKQKIYKSRDNINIE